MKMPGFNAELSLLRPLRPNNIYRVLGIGVSVSLPIYGNYCGPGHGDPTGETPPINDVDACCRIHDMCYSERGYFDCYCDKELIDCIKTKRSGWTPKGRAAAAIWAYFNLQPCVSHGGGRSGGRGGSPSSRSRIVRKLL